MKSRDRKKFNSFCKEIETFSERGRHIVTRETLKRLEMEGSQMVMDLCLYHSFQYWEQALSLREKYSMPRDEDSARINRLYPPFKSVKELKERRLQMKYMMLEGLNNYIRWMSPSHILTIEAAIVISENLYEDDYITNEFLMDMFRLNWENSNPLDMNVHFLFKNIIDIRSHRRSQYFNCVTASKEISMYMDYIEEKILPYLKDLSIKESEKREHAVEIYVDVAYYLLRFTQFFLEAGPSNELANALLYKLTGLLKEEKRGNLPTTLLHQAVKMAHLFGVKLLVQYGAEINTPDFRNYLPIHHVESMRELHDETKNVASFLIRNGSEVDTESYDGCCVQEFLQEIKLLKNKMEKVTLKCLAARAISKHKIKVIQEECPKNLIHIIKIHGGHIV